MVFRTMQNPLPHWKRHWLTVNAAAVHVTLNTADIQAIEALLKKYPDTGDRYNESNYRFVDKN